MKINGNLIESLEFDAQLTDENEELLGNNHVATSADTPLNKEAPDISDNEKIQIISHHFRKIMETLGLDLKDDSLRGTPDRVAKMYVKEIFSGLNEENKPAYTLFENKFNFKEMLVEKDISLYSSCEHHFVPIIGKAHVAYFSGREVIGLSKINRIVQYFAKRPQVQERLTVQIADELKRVLRTDDVAVVIESTHLCVSMRGVQDHSSLTTTSHYGGKFSDQEIRREFLSYLKK